MPLPATIRNKHPRTTGIRVNEPRMGFYATLLAATMFTWAAAGGPEALVPIGILVNGVTLVFGEPEDHFPMVITWGLTSDVMVINERSVFSFLLGLFLLRVFMAVSHRGTRLNAMVTVSALVLIACQVAGETINGAPMYRATEIALMLLVFVSVLALYDWNLVDFPRATITFIFCAILVLAGSVVAGGGDIGKYLDAADNLTRLGEDVRVLGGAMAIPIFVLVSTTLLLTPVIRRRTARPTWRALLSLALVSAGLLTVSRSLIVGLVVLVLAAAGIAFARGRLGVVGALLIVAGAAVWSLTAGPLSQIADRFGARNAEAGLLSGRDGIYSDALHSLTDDPMWALTGKGAMGYVASSAESGSLLSYSAHNLFLDIVLSWGFVGLISLIVIVWVGANRLLTQTHLKLDAPSLLTGLAVSICFMSGGSLWYFSSYVFMLVSISLGFVVGRNVHSESQVR